MAKDGHEEVEKLGVWLHTGSVVTTRRLSNCREASLGPLEPLSHPQRQNEGSTRLRQDRLLERWPCSPLGKSSHAVTVLCLRGAEVQGGGKLAGC